MAKFKWAYIGSGNIAYSTARSILKGDHEITAVYSRTYKKAVDFAEKFGAKVYESFEALLSEGNFDGVYIATPHTSHVEYAVAALKAHKPVLCEKPVGVSVKDVELLIETAKENDLDPYEYPKYVFTKAPNLEESESVDILLPWNAPDCCRSKSTHSTE